MEVREERLGNVYDNDRFTGGNFGGNVWGSNGIAPTMKTGASASQQCIVEVNKMSNYVLFPQTVKVRKHEIDYMKLCDLLRKSKSESKLNNKEIAKALGIPKTLVEHWFRRDKSFAIPDTDIWFQLKELLGIKTDKYDAAITEFEERDGVFDKSERVYLPDSIAPTMTTVSADEKIVEVKKMIIGIDEQNMTTRTETFGTIMADGSSPKHNNRVGEVKKIRIKQATKQGFIECEVPGIADLTYPSSTTRRGRCERGASESNADSGEYP